MIHHRFHSISVSKLCRKPNLAKSCVAVSFQDLQRKLFSNSAVATPKLKVSKEYALKVLGLRTFTDEEIRKSYDNLKITSETVDSHQQGDADVNVIDLRKSISQLLQTLHNDSKHYSSEEINIAASKITCLLTDSNYKKETASTTSDNILVSYDQYSEKVINLGKKLDPRTVNIALSFLMAGSSVGIMIPCMPILISQLGPFY